MQPMTRRSKTLVYGLMPWMRHAVRHARDLVYTRNAIKACTIEYYGYELEIPLRHKLISLRAEQPNRDAGLFIAAKEIFSKHPAKLFVDIGANVGDTAAVVQAGAACDMILVEPSPVFYPYLSRNVRQFGERAKTRQSFLVAPDDTDVRFRLLHSDGTAQPKREAPSKGRGPENLTLSDLSTSAIGLVKVDTDGYDLSLINAYMDQLAASETNLYFELEVRSADDVAAWSACLHSLLEKGFMGLLVWDDAGHFICSATSLMHVVQLLQWQLSYMKENFAGIQRVFNFDVLAVVSPDRDLFATIERSYR
jgi:FkbM family methyltransferase